MKLGQLKGGREERSSRRRNLRLELLEDRNLLSTSALAHVAPAEVQSATQFVPPMTGTIEGVATLGQTTIDRKTKDLIVPVESTASGNLSNLGLVTLTEKHNTRILASTNYTTSAVSDGQATIIAANGDSLSLTFNGSGVRTLYGFEDTFNYTITGGTGRFTGASGSGVIHSTNEAGTPTQVPFSSNLEGVISMVGWSNRSNS